MFRWFVNMGCSTSSVDVQAPSPFQEACFFGKYYLGRKFGKGTLGQVHSATSVSGVRFAVKVQRVKADGKSQQVWDAPRREGEMWRSVSGHQNIVELIECFEHVEELVMTSYMVMEVCVCCVLEGLKSESTSARCFREMLNGLAHMHSRGVVHRNVKADNFLFGGEDGQTTKLVDFSLAAKLPRGGLLLDVVGSPPYMSPEMLGKSGYNQKTDVWALGVTAYLILFGSFPYMPEIRTDIAMKALILKGIPHPTFQVPDPALFVRHEASLFVRDLLERDVANRRSAQETLDQEDSFLQPVAARSFPAVPRESPRGSCSMLIGLQHDAALDSPKSAPQSSLAASPAQRRCLSAAKALSGEFDTRPDPTVERDLDDLLQHLQTKYDPDAALATFSKRSFSYSTLDLESNAKEPLCEALSKLVNSPSEEGVAVKFVPSPFRKRSCRQTCAPSSMVRGSTWSVGGVGAHDYIECDISSS